MRRIIANRIANSGRYSDENTVAYQLGNAANIAAPAVISHTSLASQTGPMVFSTARLRFSGSPSPAAPSGTISMPTPKSNPSRTRKPRNSAAMRKNHSS